MKLADKLEKIEKEIENGLKFKSADRLKNLIKEYPNNIEVWEKLAELYYKSGFLDAAGKYWIFTQSKEAKIRRCVEIYEKSVGYSGTQILNDIKFRGDKEKWSEFAQKKLAALEKDSKHKSNYIPEFFPNYKRNKKISTPKSENKRERIISYLLSVLFIAIPILAIIGLVRVIQWVF